MIGAATRELQRLRGKNRAEWVRRIKRALERSAGYVPAAAEALGTSASALKAWIRGEKELVSLPRPGPGRPPKVGPEERAKIVRLRAEGVPRKKVAEALGISERHVSTIANP